MGLHKWDSIAKTRPWTWFPAKNKHSYAIDFWLFVWSERCHHQITSKNRVSLKALKWDFCSFCFDGIRSSPLPFTFEEIAFCIDNKKHSRHSTNDGKVYIFFSWLPSLSGNLTRLIYAIQGLIGLLFGMCSRNGVGHATIMFLQQEITFESHEQGEEGRTRIFLTNELTPITSLVLRPRMRSLCQASMRRTADTVPVKMTHELQMSSVVS